MTRRRGTTGPAPRCAAAGFVRIALLCTVVVLVAEPAIDHWA
ncbi:hypothetical protein [Streptomyces sp. NPDC058695]